MRQEIEQNIAQACFELFNTKPEVQLTRPDEQFGDFATNIALHLAKSLAKNPYEVAKAITENVKGRTSHIKEVSVAGPGFINFTLTDQALLELADEKPAQSLAGKTVVAEYSDPNPFKVLHAGHIYTTVVGDAISQLLELSGATVHRVNYGGDVGLHVGKTLWAILRTLGGAKPKKLGEISSSERTAWLSRHYVEGNNAYEDNRAAKAEIINLNKQVYEFHSKNDKQSELAQIYWTCRQWSYEAFDAFYAQLGTKIEKYYPESEVTQLGLEAVKNHTGDVFELSDGAVVFKGENYGLHTRVFINSQGLPTYEAKEVGLIIKKYQDYKFDLSVVITGNEQQEYMAVMLKAIEQFLPELTKASKYIPHGMVRLAGGIKMSSRKGNIIPATEVLELTTEANKKIHGKDDKNAVLAAVKYSFLKSRIGGDIIYDPAESVAIEGNSGPYLQYSYARARSILSKAQPNSAAISDLQPGERTLLRKVSEFAEVVDMAASELMPHYICTYLYDLAQVFNRFYENNRVIGDPRQALRLQLVNQYANTLKSGLALLNIPAPERM